MLLNVRMSGAQPVDLTENWSCLTSRSGNSGYEQMENVGRAGKCFTDRKL